MLMRGKKTEMVVMKGIVDNKKRSIAIAEGLHTGQPTVPMTVPVCVTMVVP